MIVPKKLTVEKLINILKKCKHKRTARVTFNIEANKTNDVTDEWKDVEYDIDRVGQFGVVPDVIIDLTERAAEDYT